MDWRPRRERIRKMRIAGMRLQNLADNCKELQIAGDAQMWETAFVSRFASKIHIWTGQQVRGSPICKLQMAECKSNAGQLQEGCGRNVSRVSRTSLLSFSRSE